MKTCAAAGCASTSSAPLVIEMMYDSQASGPNRSSTSRIATKVSNVVRCMPSSGGGLGASGCPEHLQDPERFARAVRTIAEPSAERADVCTQKVAAVGVPETMVHPIVYNIATGGWRYRPVPSIARPAALQRELPA